MSISVAIITLNEERNIEACLRTVNWADEIVIVDSGSSDRTMILAKQYASKIISHPFRDFAEQKNEALKHCTGDWVFLIDADERVTPLLAEEIKKVVKANRKASYLVKRKTVLFGKELHYSGTQDDFQMRLFPKGTAHFTQPIHEKVVTTLPVKKLRNSLLHHSTANMDEYKKKLDRYIPFELALIRQSERNISTWEIFLKPPAKFIFLYFFKLGCLDGIAGFKVAALAAYYDFVKLSKGREALESAVPNPLDRNR